MSDVTFPFFDGKTHKLTEYLGNNCSRTWLRLDETKLFILDMDGLSASQLLGYLGVRNINFRDQDAIDREGAHKSRRR